MLLVADGMLLATFIDGRLHACAYRNPSKRSRLSYLWVVSKSSDEQTVVSALKTLLATESGPQLLESLMTLVHMLLRTPTLDGPHPRRLLAMIFEEWYVMGGRAQMWTASSAVNKQKLMCLSIQGPRLDGAGARCSATPLRRAEQGSRRAELLRCRH